MADQSGIKPIATNRAAGHNYFLSDTYECGMVLHGSEVKALRETAAQITEAFAQMREGELFLHNLHIAPYSHAQSHTGHDPVRVRKLLLNRRELDRISHKLKTDRYSLVPTKLYFKDGKAKVEIALGKGKTKGDRRQDLAEKEAKRETEREVGRALKHR